MHLFEITNELIEKYDIPEPMHDPFHQAVRSISGASHVAVQEMMPQWAGQQDLPADILQLYISENKVKLTSDQVQLLHDRVVELLPEEVLDVLGDVQETVAVLDAFNHLSDEEQENLVVMRLKSVSTSLCTFPEQEAQLS